ncbi:DUF7139 domain-containing protein [Halovivax gelatinilyticus]|uniref:DUF7139 domain-containing protein n=1 Tax=Halovivax gelatinilyticus TaxID=2961597 RepID=UPI0020CA3BE9|nr:permease [Halovivax gelatinilyticus]
MSSLPDQRLFDLYRTYIGEPDSERDVYVGFGLFLCGIVLATVALVLFIWSSTFEARTSSHTMWAEPAYALGMLSLPIVMVGVVVLLPSERKVIATSFAGAAVASIAVAGFLVAYPDDWNGYGADHTVEIVTIYAIGLTGLTASTGAALIAHYLDLARQLEPAHADSEEEQAEHYTDEEIAADIDAAMEDVELSWGGVEKSDNTTLTFTDNEFEEANVGTMGVTKTRSTGVQSQVAGLKGLKGGEAKTATSDSTVDDQTAKLKELREKKQAEKLATKDGGPLDGVRNRVERSIGAVKAQLAGVRNRVKRN